MALAAAFGSHRTDVQRSSFSWPRSVGVIWRRNDRHSWRYGKRKNLGIQPLTEIGRGRLEVTRKGIA
ncbi:hypothetical protein UCMB321_0828 [Pseudomonas batumici]|uniref:Uncharacterized protein n=1 Tax=Pseudomonas batumici TaxID=226910 RepID=A0A0C2EH32_9PSED|nr:hypothetical protein UCMB321_0828 [Pseudomonas batumici]